MIALCRLPALFTFALIAATVFAQEDVPEFHGYITSIASPTDFMLDGRHVLLQPDAQIVSEPVGATILPLFIGQAVKVSGPIDGSGARFVVKATRVVLTQPHDHPVAGSGLVEAVRSSNAPGEYLVRADGYLVRITQATKVVYDPPFTSADPVQPNLWLIFSGTQHPDGSVFASHAEWSSNLVTGTGEKMRQKSEYAPESVPPDEKQGPLSKAFLGENVKKLPPWPDPVMQARVVAIGTKLVPAFVKALPASDPTRLDFRFQVIDEKHWRDAINLPNGIILISHQTVERMANDSQLAAVLADNIAAALEKQAILAHPAQRSLLAANIAGVAAGFLVPGAGLATNLATGGVNSHLERLREDQSGRVSLFLLHDAGFEIDQAPLAWWRLHTRHPDQLSGATPPFRALYLYKILGETWRIPAPASTPSSAP